MESTIMNLILNSGNARSYAMEAIQASKEGDFEGAQDLMEKSNEQLNEAHKVQTTLIQAEAGGNKTEISLLLVHAQDHLMTSITFNTLAKEIIDLHKKITK